MAQRKGELLKMEMLEKLASLHRDLREEVELATQAGGASHSAIQAAKELLGCNEAREAAALHGWVLRTALNAPPCSSWRDGSSELSDLKLGFGLLLASMLMYSFIVDSTLRLPKRSTVAWHGCLAQVSKLSRREATCPFR